MFICSCVLFSFDVMLSKSVLLLSLPKQKTIHQHGHFDKDSLGLVPEFLIFHHPRVIVFAISLLNRPFKILGQNTG